MFAIRCHTGAWGDSPISQLIRRERARRRFLVSALLDFAANGIYRLFRPFRAPLTRSGTRPSVADLVLPRSTSTLTANAPRKSSRPSSAYDDGSVRRGSWRLRG